MKHEKKPAKAKPVKSASIVIKLLHRRHVNAVGSEALGLKPFARRLLSEAKFAGSADERSDVQLVKDWFHNKRANFKVPQLGIGKTTKKKGSK